MPYGRRSFRKRRSFQITDSIKNVNSQLRAQTAGTIDIASVSVATDTGINAGVADVERGSKTFRIWVEFWVSATQVTAIGVSTIIDAYLFKNPGNNLTPPNPGTTGTSNEKKFVIREWRGLVGTRLDGFPAYSFRGWIKIPKIYQRNGTDDRWQFVIISTGSDTITCAKFVYKWFK